MDSERMSGDSALRVACALMTDFAQRTGLVDGSDAVVRYLWTDAFAVCNFIELFRRTGDAVFRSRALHLVSQVHGVLGRHRGDDSRAGWISGLGDDVGAEHPTAGGLRIGKPLTERAADEPPDATLEWDRDGQYFHYLTKWMHALNQAARMSGDLRFLQHALELARTAHRGFTYAPAGAVAPRMYWKMSIALDRPLVSSMGHHDPLDALVTYRELQMTSRRLAVGLEVPQLEREVSDAAAMCAGQDWTTDDPLGIGGLLFDAYRVAQMSTPDPVLDTGLLESLLRCADRGLHVFSQAGTAREPARFRLAFRELGLSIGLHALARTRTLLSEQWQRLRNGPALLRRVDDMQRFLRLGSELETFWLDTTNRQSSSWLDHRDINTVMLATTLVPDGFLCIREHDEREPGASLHPANH